MKVVQINSYCGKGSTGKICVGISEASSTNGINNIIVYSHSKSNYNLSHRITNMAYIKVQSVKSHLFGNYGFNSFFSTKKLVKFLKKYNPDIIHIHNIHGHDVNFKMLFKYISDFNKKVVYTFHDCWAFTGYCPYFTYAGCEKWKTKCSECPLKKKYSFLFDLSLNNYKNKKKSFSLIDLNNIVIAAPSKWMENLVKESFLKEIKTIVINNGIDLNVFKPTTSSFRRDFSLEDKYIILGVADSWEKRKGLDVFLYLSSKLSNDFKIVLVGTNEKVDKSLPSSIISIHRTTNQVELAKLYSAADLFVNPTREDNFPTVNLESLACGTPVITFDTGGSPESIDDTCGRVVDCDDIEGLLNNILSIKNTRPFTREACLKKAASFDYRDRFQQYIELYRNLLDK